MGVLLVLFFFSGLSVWPAGRQAPASQAADPGLVKELQALIEAREWERVLRILPQSAEVPAELDYYRGLALAGLQRWGEAASAFLTGQEKAPGDKRFPLELAGVDFKQGNLDVALRHLCRALKLDPADSYARDFLAGVYFLQGNQEAALQNWNRVGRPVLEGVKAVPVPRLDPVLLDRCYAFAPASLLRWEDYQTTRARLQSLQIFSSYRLELVPRADGKFDSVLRSIEKHGWGGSKLESLVSVFRGLPYRTVLPEYFGIRRSAVNFQSLARWDPQKRRIAANLAGPIARTPEWRFHFRLDGRDEEWDLTPQDGAALGLPARFRMRTLKGETGVERLVGGRWMWETSVEAGTREYDDRVPQDTDTSALFARGFSLKQSARVGYEVLSLPTRRLTLRSSAAGRWGKVFEGTRGPWGSLSAGLDLTWFPRPRGSDYRFGARLSAARSGGAIPFDELYSLGFDRDNEIYFRAHNGIVEGRKGAGPLAADYFLFSLDLDKDLYRKTLWRVVLTPYLDSGKAWGIDGRLGSGRWLWDIGLQLKLVFFERVSLILSYGKDLRSGRNTFFSKTY